METNLYTTTIPVMRKTILALDAILDKAASFAESKRTPRRAFEEALLGSRLVFDQFPFYSQIQRVSDSAKSGAARLAGVEAPVMDDTEKTFKELKERLAKTVAFLDTIKPEDVIGQENRKVTLPYYPGKFLTAGDYAREHMLPNFFFHVVTAYAILRHNGLDIGKTDFIGELTLHDEQA